MTKKRVWEKRGDSRNQDEVYCRGQGGNGRHEMTDIREGYNVEKESERKDYG